MSRNHVWMLLHQQFFKIHLCNKRKENHLKQFFVGVCVCVPLCVFLYMCLYISVCVPLCVCVSLCVSQCVSAINLCLFKHNAFDIHILLLLVFSMPGWMINVQNIMTPYSNILWTFTLHSSDIQITFRLHSQYIQSTFSLLLAWLCFMRFSIIF